MNKRDFRFRESRYAGAGTYTATLDGFKIEIPEQIFTEETIAFAQKVLEIYPSRLHDLASFCRGSECFQMCYPEESVESIIEKLHDPIVKIDGVGGCFTYCNHELDHDHLIDLEFEGLIEKFFSVGIDG